MFGNVDLLIGGIFVYHFLFIFYGILVGEIFGILKEVLLAVLHGLVVDEFLAVLLADLHLLHEVLVDDGQH